MSGPATPRGRLRMPRRAPVVRRRPERASAVIDVRDMVKTFSLGQVQVHALRGVSLRIERGDFVAIMGSSGSGKSTLMNILGCLDIPTSGRYRLDGTDVSRRIREQDVTSGASQVSVHPQLRVWMVAQQRLLGAAGGVVMEGRDIGTVVFPDAEVKIFLDAAPEVRGNRRYRQAVPGEGPAQSTVTEAAVIQDLKDRDARDRNRADSPLRPAADAVILDSTGLTLDEVLASAEAIVHRHIG